MIRNPDHVYHEEVSPRRRAALDIANGHLSPEGKERLARALNVPAKEATRAAADHARIADVVGPELAAAAVLASAQAKAPPAPESDAAEVEADAARAELAGRWKARAATEQQAAALLAMTGETDMERAIGKVAAWKTSADGVEMQRVRAIIDRAVRDRKVSGSPPTRAALEMLAKTMSLDDFDRHVAFLPSLAPMHVPDSAVTEDNYPVDPELRAHLTKMGLTVADYQAARRAEREGGFR